MSCCGIVGGARVSICGDVPLILCAGLRVFGVDRCCVRWVEGPLISSGKRKECMLAVSEMAKYGI